MSKVSLFDIISQYKDKKGKKNIGGQNAKNKYLG